MAECECISELRNTRSLHETAGATTRLEPPANLSSAARLGGLYLSLNPCRQLLLDLDRVSGEQRAGRGSPDPALLRWA
ncbi:MAG: hypothetical protein ACHRXM_35305 [Isosphaerales bacterium]